MAQLPAVINTAEVLERYSKGEPIAKIARSLKCHETAVYARLLKEIPDQWKEAASSRALSNLDKAEEELQTAPDMLSVTRARAWAEIQRWKLERLLRRYFGQDQPAGAGNAVQININLRSAGATNGPDVAHNVIDAEKV